MNLYFELRNQPNIFYSNTMRIKLEIIFNKAINKIKYSKKYRKRKICYIPLVNCGLSPGTYIEYLLKIEKK